MNTVDALSHLLAQEKSAMVSQQTLDAIGAAVGDLATQFSGARPEDQGKFYELDFRASVLQHSQVRWQLQRL